jgi:hypothetical protein
MPSLLKSNTGHIIGKYSTELILICGMRKQAHHHTSFLARINRRDSISPEYFSRRGYPEALTLSFAWLAPAPLLACCGQAGFGL